MAVLLGSNDALMFVNTIGDGQRFSHNTADHVYINVLIVMKTYLLSLSSTSKIRNTVYPELSQLWPQEDFFFQVLSLSLEGSKWLNVRGGGEEEDEPQQIDNLRNSVFISPCLLMLFLLANILLPFLVFSTKNIFGERN